MEERIRIQQEEISAVRTEPECYRPHDVNIKGWQREGYVLEVECHFSSRRRAMARPIDATINAPQSLVDQPFLQDRKKCDETL